MTDTVRIATRGSRLALTQTGIVAAAVTAQTGRPCEPTIIRTEGDDLAGPLTGGRRPGLFTSAVRDALLRGDADLAVHSFKDLPSAPEPGLVIAAVPERAIPFDALVGAVPLAQLPVGSRVGTSSPRRAAALRRARPDLVVVGLRGNVDSRLQKVADGEVDAAILAAAGLERLGRLDAAVELLDPAIMVPAPAQGALAVECREGTPLAAALAALDHGPTRLAVTAERAVLRGIEAACTTAVGAYAEVQGPTLALTAELADHRGVDHARVTQSAAVNPQAAVTSQAAAEDLGRRVAHALLECGPRLPSA